MEKIRQKYEKNICIIPPDGVPGIGAGPGVRQVWGVVNGGREQQPRLGRGEGLLVQKGSPFFEEECEVRHVLGVAGEFPVEVEAVEAVVACGGDGGLDEGGAGGGGAGHGGEGGGVGPCSAYGEDSLGFRGGGVEGGGEGVHPLIVVGVE